MASEWGQALSEESQAYLFRAPKVPTRAECTFGANVAQGLDRQCE